MLKLITVILGGILVWGIGADSSANGQSTAGDWAWNEILEHEGVRFYYIFYSEADNENNGIVIKLVNTNDFAVTYRFKVVFRAGEAMHVEPVEGHLKAGEIKTGDTAGLFWVPFKDGRTIGEIGLRGYAVSRISDSG